MIDVMGSVLCPEKLLQMCTVFFHFKSACSAVLCHVVPCGRRQGVPSSRGETSWVGFLARRRLWLRCQCCAPLSRPPVPRLTLPVQKRNGLACLRRVLRPSLLRILRIRIPSWSFSVSGELHCAARYRTPGREPLIWRDGRGHHTKPHRVGVHDGSFGTTLRSRTGEKV